jgi:putative transposase
MTIRRAVPNISSDLPAETRDFFVDLLGFRGGDGHGLGGDPRLGERRPEDRMTHRNGYRPREWQTRAGTIELQIPKLRRGSYFPSFLEPHRRSEQALLAVVQQAYVCGVSTRRVDQLVESLGLRISKSEVSRVCQALDEHVEAFRTRPLEGAYPYLFLDAKVEKVRDGGRVVNKALVIAHGVHGTGRREILSIDVGEAETEASWTTSCAAWSSAAWSASSSPSATRTPA